MSLEEKLSKPTLREIMTKKEEAEGMGETWDTKKFLKALGKIVSKEDKLRDIYAVQHSAKKPNDSKAPNRHSSHPDRVKRESETT